MEGNRADRTRKQRGCAIVTACSMTDKRGGGNEEVVLFNTLSDDPGIASCQMDSG
jgi:hypothetical protein